MRLHRLSQALALALVLPALAQAPPSAWGSPRAT